jgi:hypothetical protein
MWVEVKSIDPDDSRAAVSDTLLVLKSLAVPQNLRGEAILHVNADTRPQSVRGLVKMFQITALEFASERTCLMFIQQCPDKSDVRRVEVHGDVVQHVWVRGAGKTYGILSRWMVLKRTPEPRRHLRFLTRCCPMTVRS